MANRLHELKQTSATFQARGIVAGMKKEKAYQSGTTKAGGQWNSLEFMLNINNNKAIFIKLRGFPRNEVCYYKGSEVKGEKGTTVKVPWKDRKKSPGDGYRLIGVNISTGKDENGKNVNEVFTEYDAVEYLHNALQDGESLFIKGDMNFSSYVGKDGQAKRSVELNPTQISYTQKPVDFDEEGYEEMAEFENTLVFTDIEKETDENGKNTGRFVLSGYSIGYNTIESVSFIVDENHTKLANNLKKNMKPGYAIKTYGKIFVTNNIEAVETNDDGWGDTSPMERINSPSKREYIVYKGVPESIEKETYSEAEIAKAIKAIKNAKEASEKFVDTSDDTNADDWGTDDDGEDTPW